MSSLGLGAPIKVKLSDGARVLPVAGFVALVALDRTSSTGQAGPGARSESRLAWPAPSFSSRLEIDLDSMANTNVLFSSPDARFGLCAALDKACGMAWAAYTY